MYSPTRDQSRAFFFESWRKFKAGEPLVGLERIGADIAVQHPEYHALLDDPERHAGRDFRPEHGEVNPFLHLALHLAIEEQISIDQPPGVRHEFERLAAKLTAAHEAQHAMLECLAEMIWEVQSARASFDPGRYLDSLRRR